MADKFDFSDEVSSVSDDDAVLSENKAALGTPGNNTSSRTEINIGNTNSQQSDNVSPSKILKSAHSQSRSHVPSKSALKTKHIATSDGRAKRRLIPADTALNKSTSSQAHHVTDSTTTQINNNTDDSKYDTNNITTSHNDVNSNNNNMNAPQALQKDANKARLIDEEGKDEHKGGNESNVFENNIASKPVITKAVPINSVMAQIRKGRIYSGDDDINGVALNTGIYTGLKGNILTDGNYNVRRVFKISPVDKRPSADEFNDLLHNDTPPSEHAAVDMHYFNAFKVNPIVRGPRKKKRYFVDNYKNGRMKNQYRLLSEIRSWRQRKGLGIATLTPGGYIVTDECFPAIDMSGVMDWLYNTVRRPNYADIKINVIPNTVNITGAAIAYKQVNEIIDLMKNVNTGVGGDEDMISTFIMHEYGTVLKLGHGFKYLATSHTDGLAPYLSDTIRKRTPFTVDSDINGIQIKFNVLGTHVQYPRTSFILKGDNIYNISTKNISDQLISFVNAKIVAIITTYIMEYFQLIHTYAIGELDLSLILNSLHFYAINEGDFLLNMDDIVINANTLKLMPTWHRMIKNNCINNRKSPNASKPPIIAMKAWRRIMARVAFMDKHLMVSKTMQSLSTNTNNVVVVISDFPDTIFHGIPKDTDVVKLFPPNTKQIVTDGRIIINEIVCSLFPDYYNAVFTAGKTIGKWCYIERNICDHRGNDCYLNSQFVQMAKDAEEHRLKGMNASHEVIQSAMNDIFGPNFCVRCLLGLAKLDPHNGFGCKWAPDCFTGQQISPFNARTAVQETQVDVITNKIAMILLGKNIESFSKNEIVDFHLYDNEYKNTFRDLNPIIAFTLGFVDRFVGIGDDGEQCVKFILRKNEFKNYLIKKIDMVSKSVAYDFTSEYKITKQSLNFISVQNCGNKTSNNATV